jgi:nucleoside recognition membrane protein YjiH
VVLPGVFCLLYLLLVVPPFAPFFLPGDVSVYLLNAARMLNEAIYKDFFQFTTPGTELAYLALFRLFGARAWVPNAMLL